MGRRIRSLGGLGAAVAVLALPCAAPGATLLPKFTETAVVEDLVYPTAVSFAPGGRIYIAEKSGLVKTVRGPGDRKAKVVADLRTDVHNFHDRGLLGMTLHPRFPKRPHIYVLYSRDAPLGGSSPTWGAPDADSDDCPEPPGADDGCVIGSRLTRLTVKGRKLKRTKVLLDDWCQQFQSHSAGDLVFGPSGALYVSGGDGASFQFADYGQFGSPPNPCGDPPVGVGGQQTPPTAEGGALRAQDLRTSADPLGLNGTVIRVDPRTGAGVPENPFASSPDANARRIVSFGHRNPFRLAIRPGTEELWVADVGSEYFDEINRVPPTLANFGWPCFEGSSVNPAWDALDLDLCESLYSEQQASGQAVAHPWFAYGRQAPVVAGDGCAPGQSALSGLSFYRGGDFPKSYDGALFFADYARSCIWVLEAGADGLPDPASVRRFAAGAGGPVDLELGPGGLYYVDLIGGAVRRIGYAGGNRPPRAALHASRTFGDSPLRVRFSAAGSRDPEPTRLRYSWDLDGDGRFGDSRRRRVEEVYRRSRPLTVRLRVFDRRRQRDTDEVRIFPGDTPPRIELDRPRRGQRWTANDSFRFAGSARDREDGAVPARALDWELLLRHCREDEPCHTHPVQELAGRRRGSFATPEHEYPSFLKLRVTATDSDGLAVSREVRLRPHTARVTLQSEPSGLVLGLNDDYGPTPTARRVIIGARFTLTAPTPQELNGVQYDWLHWSDGGARSHETVAGGDLAVGATFAASGPG